MLMPSPDQCRSTTTVLTREMRVRIMRDPVASLDLPEEYLSAIESRGITTVWELLQCDTAQLLSWNRIGPIGIRVIRGRTERYLIGIGAVLRHE